METSPEHLLLQARDRFALQDYYGAVHFLEELLARGRAFADAHHLLGLSLSLLGQTERALAAFDEALAINPRYLEAHVHRGIILNALGRTAEAERAFQAAAGEGAVDRVAGFPRPIASRLANLHAGLGNAYAEAGALGPALDQYRRAVELGPTYHDLRYKLARLLLEAGQALAAREELEQIVAANPDFLDAHASLGLARYLSGDVEGAQATWAACLARRPDSARVSAYLSMASRSDDA